MTRRRAVAVVLVLLAAAAVAALRRDKAPALSTAVVRKGEFIDYLQLRGEIRPVRSVVLTAPSSGADLLIVQLAKNGTNVAVGDVVVQFDTTMQQRTLEQKESELKQAASEIAKAEADERRRIRAADAELIEARSAAARARLDMGKAEVVSRIDGAKYVLAAADADAHVGELQKKVEGERIAAAADVAIAKQKRDKALFDVRETERILASLTVKAPSNGLVSLLPNYRAGGGRQAPEFRTGDRAWFGAPIAELPDLSSVQMNCRVDEADRARIQAGRAAAVRVDALPDRELKGSLREIAVMAKPDFTTWPPVRNFDIVVGLLDADSRLRTGMSASARVEIERLPNVLLVPTSAVFQRGGATVVYVGDANGVAARPVTILRRGRDEIAVASGVAEGEHVSLKEPPAEASR